MKQLTSIFLALIVIVLAPSSNSYANSNGEVLVWKPLTFRPAFVHTANHIDLSKKIKWYSWDVENRYFLSFRQPFSIRLAQEVKIIDIKASCTNVPIRVKRELSKKEATDVSNQTLIQFFQADFGLNRGITRSQLYSKPIIFTIDSSSWNVDDDEIQLAIPICANSIGKSLAELIGNSVTMNLRIAYSTNFDENLNKIDPKCDEILGDKCMFYSPIQPIFGVKFSESNLDLESLNYAYQESIDKEKSYLQAKPCEIPYASYDQQSNSNKMIKDNKAICEASKRNLDFLNSELEKAKRVVSPSSSPTSATKVGVSSSPTPTSSPLPKITGAVLSQKSTITCIKGKLTKKVTAVKPKCPSGYKKK